MQGWAAGDSGVIIKTSNGGINWNLQQSGISQNIHYIFFLNKRLGWALSWVVSDNPMKNFGTIILKTTNGGDNWNSDFYPIDSYYLNSIMFLDSLNGWIGGYPRPLLNTTNGGLNWSNVYIDTTGPNAFPARYVAFYNNRIGFACGGAQEYAGVIYRTTDFGISWKGYGVAPEPINRVFIFDSLNIIGVGGGPDEGPSIVTTTNGGNNWKLNALVYWGVPFSCSYRTRAEGWVPLGYVPDFLITTDSSRTWSEIVTPDSSFIYDVVFTDYRNGFCVGDSGVVYKFNYQSVNISKTEILIPADFKLYQNYPNPFNPSTKIKFDIANNPLLRGVGEARGVYTQLKIYDITGREIQTLVNEQLSPGSYEVTFDGTNFSSGIYFYQLNTGNFTETKKMLLIK